jgi:uncharacterized damage-inducible protein DinB
MMTTVQLLAPAYSDYLKYVKNPFLLSELAESHAGAMETIGRICEEKGNYAYAPGKWTVKDVLQHLCDSERIFCYRALAFSRGEQLALPGYDHEAYVSQADASHRTCANLKNELENLRISTMDMFRSFTEQQLKATGTANNKQVSVQALGFIIAGHQRHHIHILNERYL